jgi:glycosyltransferase involved in cell wall biosynthesis
VAGDGPLREPLLARAAELGIADRVHLLGHRRDVEVVLAGLDVFVLSSVSEGLSNTILEAMATGVPVVATHVGGADELVRHGETGLLVTSGAPEEIGSALKRLQGDPAARRDFGRAGRARVEEAFALTTMIQKYESLYLEMAGRVPTQGLRSRFRTRERYGTESAANV